MAEVARKGARKVARLATQGGAGKRKRGGYGPRQLAVVVRKWKREIMARGIAAVCQVDISLQDGWFVLDGSVDCFATKCVLFGLIPEREGARWIIDRVRVGRPATVAAE